MKQLQHIKSHEGTLLVGTVILLIILFGVMSYRRHQNSVSSNVSPKEGSLSVTFLDAGKADAIVIRTNDSTVLIDTGLKSNAKKLVNYLENQGIDTIDYMILTHFDKDHVGGAAKVIDKLKVNHIITSDYYKDSKEVENYLEACDEAQIVPQALEDVIYFTLDDVTYTVYPHIATSYPEQESNNTSLIVSIEHGDNRMLFTGDATDLRIKEFLTKQETNFEYQLLKVPYHGHYMECLQQFVNTIQPEYAVITSSEKEKEDEATLQILENVNANVFLTREGIVTAISDGKELKVSNE